MMRVLDDLSDEHRQTIILREFEGLSYDEIARATGVSSGTVMSRLFYARKKLQSALAELG
jgi:RNA polymerase sigma-70 factor (ECF subfamily)